MVARIEFRLSPELKHLIGSEARKLGLTMNEYLASLVAEKIRRPELAKIPRKPLGRHPKTTR